MANLAIGMPELQISISLIASGREIMLLDYLNALDLPTKDFPWPIFLNPNGPCAHKDS